MVMDWLGELMEAIHCCAIMRSTTTEWYDYLDWIAPELGYVE
jgi:hypothetical protein